MRRVEILTLAVGVVLTLGSLFFQAPAVTAGVGAGALLAAANFYLLRRIVAKVTAGDIRTQTIFLLVFFFKFAVLVAVIYLLLKHTAIDTPAFAVGISSIFIALILEGIRWFFQQTDGRKPDWQQPEVPGAPDS